MLAYSSIAHAGYTLMGLAAVSVMGTQGVLLYMLVYLVMNLGAFVAIIVVAQASGSETVDDCKGLVHRAPLAAVAFAICLFSLTGLPPFAGFTAKWFLFYAVVERIAGPGGGWYFVLAIIAALNTAVSLYFYARIIRAMFLDAPRSETAIEPRFGQQLMLGTCSVLLLVFGVWWNPIVSWSQASLAMLRL
jgi:NADH-quinone oxidoreductase subunit N